MLYKSFYILISSLVLIIMVLSSLIYIDIALFLIIPIYIIGNLIIFNKNLKDIRHVYIISLFFTFIYSIVPLIVYLFPNKFIYEINNVFQNSSNILKANLLLIISFSIYFYSSLKVLTPRKLRKVKPKVDKYEINNNFNEKLFKLGSLFLLIGCISLYWYSNIYGGIINLIKSSAPIRAGIVANSKFLFISRFITLAPISSWIFLSLKKDSYKPKASGLLFITGLLTIVINSLITASRQALLMNIIILFFIQYYDPNKKLVDYFKNIRLLIVVSFITIFILYGKNLFSYISYGSEIKRQGNTFFKLVGEFVHPYTSLLSAIEYTDKWFEVRGLIDFYYGLVELLPKRLLGIEAGKSVSYLNTLLIFGKEEGFFPPGLIGFCYYSLGSVGVLIGSYFYNILSNYFIKTCKRLEYCSYLFRGLYIFFIISFCQYIMSGDPRVYMKSYFIYYLSFFIIFVTFINSKTYNIKN